MKSSAAFLISALSIGFGFAGAPARADDTQRGREDITVSARVGAASLLGNGGGPAAEAVGEWRYSQWISLGANAGYWSTKHEDTNQTQTTYTDFAAGGHAKIFLVPDDAGLPGRTYLSAGCSLHIADRDVQDKSGATGRVSTRGSGPGTGLDTGFGVIANLSEHVAAGGDVIYHAVKATFGHSALTATVGVDLRLF